MLNRVILLLDVLLVVVAGVLGVELYRAATTPDVPTARPTSADVPTPATTEAPTTPAAAAQPPLSAFLVVTERNLFSPTRGEVSSEPPPKPAAAPAPAAKPAPPPGPKPRLYGVVLGDGTAARAYLEDPRTRKVFGYAIGDAVADSQLERIEADRVTLRRGDETYEVLLRDPSKPRPPVPVQPGPAQPGAVPVAPPGGIPGAPPGLPGAPPAVGVPGQVAPQGVQPGGPAIPNFPGSVPPLQRGTGPNPGLGPGQFPIPGVTPAVPTGPESPADSEDGPKG
jgi:hypothetical protein